MKVMRKIIEIDDKLCDGCGQCILSCAEGALQIIDGKARVVADNLCDGLGACMGECPTGALQIVEREADEFDEVAVEKHLEAADTSEAPVAKSGPGAPVMACGCPSQQIRDLSPGPHPKAHAAPGESASASSPSRLGQWPVQIRLVPASAPFLKNADLLVLADCVAVTCPDLHERLIAGRIVMMGCPKFDDVDGYVEKFKEVFEKADIRSVTVAEMEVPCCAGLPWIVKKAMDAAGKKIPAREIVFDPRGRIIADKNL
jgi:NAD-dependent dihydropyrimidine dehydrogenase PreA subunit